jgi:phage terminase small subunit
VKTCTASQEAFARHVASGSSQAEAYRKAYPKSQKWKAETVHQQASRLAGLPHVSARVKELQEAAAARAELTAADVLRLAFRLAQFDIRKLYREDGSPVPIHELDDVTATAIQAVEVTEEWEGSGDDRVFVGFTKKYKTADRNAVLDKLFKHFGLYEKDNSQQVVPVGVVRLVALQPDRGPVADEAGG